MISWLPGASSVTVKAASSLWVVVNRASRHEAAITEQLTDGVVRELCASSVGARTHQHAVQRPPQSPTWVCCIIIIIIIIFVRTHVVEYK